MLSRKGFTIAELLVTIGIIGILSSVVYINLGGATDYANKAKDDAVFSVLIKEMLIKQASQGGSTKGLCNATYNINGKSTKIRRYLRENVSFIQGTGDYSTRYGNRFGDNIPSLTTVDYYCFDADRIEGGQNFLLFVGIYPLHSGEKTTSARRPFRCFDGSVVVERLTHDDSFIFLSGVTVQTVNIGRSSSNQFPEHQDRTCEEAAEVR